jgi:hypothetical protein
MSPVALAALCARSARARRVLEFGPGLSTEVMVLMASVTGRDLEIVCVEQDAAWAQAVRQAVTAARESFGAPAGGSVQVIEAPLAAYPEPGHVAGATPTPGAPPFPITRWYDPAALDGLECPFDLVVVDGPTAYLPEWQYDRWPAIQVLASLLAPCATILLDDTDRPAEAAVAEDWLARLGPAWRTSRLGRTTWFDHTEA